MSPGAFPVFTTQEPVEGTNRFRVIYSTRFQLIIMRDKLQQVISELSRTFWHPMKLTFAT